MNIGGVHSGRARGGLPRAALFLFSTIPSIFFLNLIFKMGLKRFDVYDVFLQGRVAIDGPLQAAQTVGMPLGVHCNGWMEHAVTGLSLADTPGSVD